MWQRLDGIAGDLRHALRGIRNSPGFTVVAVTMLAVGIGVNATVFTVTSAVLFKGFPAVPEAGRLLYVSNGGCCISVPDFEDIRAQATSFSGMGLTHGIGGTIAGDAGFAARVEITEVSADAFGTLGVRPVAGRDFETADEQAGGAPVAILTYAFWESRFGKDPGVVGRTVRISGVPTTIVGIMPAGFSFPQTVDLWVPLVRTPRVLNRNVTNTWFAFGRLRPGVSFDSARGEVEGIIRRLEAVYPVNDVRQDLEVQHFHEFFIGPNAAVLYGSMWGAVGFVLLIACANLANLLLARALGRSREIAVRVALGAGRWRITRQLLLESVLLAGVGGFLGWWIARWGVRLYAAAMAQKASWLVLDYTMDGRVLGYLIAVSIGTGLAFGCLPALRLSRLDVNATLKDGARGATGGGRRLSGALVAGEMALAIVLLAGAGVMIRSFLKVHNADLGVDPRDVLVASLDLPADKYPTPETRISFYDRLTERLRSVGGVESVALASVLPSWNARRVGYELAGAPVADAERLPRAPMMKVSPEYFGTLRAAMTAGRAFDDRDTAEGVPVAIVNRKFAETEWPGEDPVGKRLRLFDDADPGPWLTVAGVVSNILQNDETRQRVEPVVYRPYRQDAGGGMWVLLRTQVPPESLATAVRREVQALDNGLPVYGPFAMEDRLERYWDSRFYGTLFLIFAAIALLLAAVGLYTVVAHAVGRRTQEIGIRFAVGATPADVLRLVFRQGMAPMAAGLAIGLAASVVVNRLLEAMLVQVSPADPLTLAGAAGLLVLAASLGCWIPARRAMRVDPVVALRQE